jgi:hypothetical protein
MGLFDFLKKSTKPYKDDAVNLIYDLLFCDDIELYKSNTQSELYPWSLLSSSSSTYADLESIIADKEIGSRVKVLAYNKLLNSGSHNLPKELLGVIVEMGLDNGTDVLAAYQDGSARYINQSGKIIVWETATDDSTALVNALFVDSMDIVKRIGPWDKPRRPFPVKGTVRITFLVSDGLYFGEGPVNVLFNDAMTAPALVGAASLMKYLVEQAVPTEA